jgi:small subunit ribosomal protein S6
MFLLDANRYARDPSGVTGKVCQMIEKCGGQILVSRLWAEQKLAYAIGNHRKGAYWLTYFRLDSRRTTELNRAARLNSDILRSLVLAVEPRLVDALVEHARGSATAELQRTAQPPEEEDEGVPAGSTPQEVQAAAVR